MVSGSLVKTGAVAPIRNRRVRGWHVPRIRCGLNPSMRFVRSVGMDPNNDLLLIELIDRIAAASLPLAQREEAFKRLYDLTASKMYGVALRVAGNREWAE